MTTDTEADRSAKRRNKLATEAAPLLAWAGLVPQTTAEAERERLADHKTSNWWRIQSRATDDVQTMAAATYSRYEISTLVGEVETERIASWVDRVGGPVFVSATLWQQARARALAGLDPVPERGYLTPTACWASFEAAILADREPGSAGSNWRACIASHAGCRREWCEVAQVGAPAPVFLGDRHAA